MAAYVSDTMSSMTAETWYPVARSKKYHIGIEVFWSREGNDNGDFFTYEDLIIQSINVLDLLDHPGVYRINPPRHSIESSA